MSLEAIGRCVPPPPAPRRLLPQQVDAMASATLGRVVDVDADGLELAPALARTRTPAPEPRLRRPRSDQRRSLRTTAGVAMRRCKFSLFIVEE